MFWVLLVGSVGSGVVDFVEVVFLFVFVDVG